MEISDIDLKKFIVSSPDGHVPATIYYIPNFLSPEEEEELLFKIDSSPKPKWTTLSNRRLQNWGGLPHPKVTVGEKLPLWLQKYVVKLSELDVFEGNVPNHVLVNEYLPGQGIMPHEDGPLFFPTITTLNLSSHTILNLKRKKDLNTDRMGTLDGGKGDSSQESFSLLLQPRSLVIITESAYTEYLHGIAEKKEDIIDEKVANLSSCPGVSLGDCLSRERRISCTIRYVSNMRKDLMSLIMKK